MKAYATLGLERGPGLENIPTAEELGVKGLDCGAWGSFSFPKDTPKEIVRAPRARHRATPSTRRR